MKNRIEEIRNEKGVRQEDLARLMGVSRNPSIMLAHKIAQYFGMAIEEVFIFEEE